MGSEEKHGDEFTRISFCLLDPKLGLKEAGNPHTHTKKKKPNKSLFFLAKGLSKGQPSKTKDLYSITILQPNITEYTVAPLSTSPAKAK